MNVVQDFFIENTRKIEFVDHDLGTIFGARENKSEFLLGMNT